MTAVSRETLYALDNWVAEGKLGLRMNGKGQSASFSWINEGPDYHVRLSGPFGQGKVSLEKEAGWVTLKSDEHNGSAASPEQLMQEALGWSLPISELVHWIKGLPSPDSPVAEARETETGNFEFLQQQGWQIRYDDYRLENGIPLPRKIVASRENIRLVLAIKRWDIQL